MDKQKPVKKKSAKCPHCRIVLVKEKQKFVCKKCGYYERPVYDHTRLEQSPRKKIKKLLNVQQEIYDKLKREYEKELELSKK